MITVKNLTIQKGSKQILKNVSVSIPNGAITVILGPNGAGKTTLLDCLTDPNGEYRSHVAMAGKPLPEFSLFEISSLRAFLSQTNTITFPFTSLEIVLFGRNPYLNTSTPEHDNEIARQALACMDALHLADQLFLTMSVGEQQRVHIARVLAQVWDLKNAYLLLDEPTTSLDLKHQHLVLSYFKDISKNHNAAICIILHDISLALQYSDNAILMQQGMVYTSGNTKEVLTSKNIQSVFDIPHSLNIVC